MYYILGPSKVVYDIYMCIYTMYVYICILYTYIHSIALHIYTHIYISKSIYKSSHTIVSVLIKVHQDNLTEAQKDQTDSLSVTQLCN